MREALGARRVWVRREVVSGAMRFDLRAADDAHVSAELIGRHDAPMGGCGRDTPAGHLFKLLRSYC